ncbi:MAG: DUF6261 family protein [Tannerellaceae bacterium]|jgi:hypothetical protein|nr:DUF6261 family protein [Tannerellaceae bacterium]
MKSVKNYTKLTHAFRNGEHFEFHKYIDDHSQPVVGGVPEASPAWAVFHNLVGQEDIVYKKSAAANETKYITAANRERYDIYTMVRQSVSAATHSFDEVVKERAVRVMEVLTNYKKIRTATMAEASALIFNMIQDLGKDRYAADVDKLGLKDAVAKLSASNDAFRKLYEERAENLESSELKGTMKEIRAQVDKAFKLYTQSLDVAYAGLKLSGKGDTSTVESIIDYINAMIDQFERALAHRGYSSVKDKPDGGGDDDPLTPSVPDGPTTPSLVISEQLVEGAERMLLIAGDQAAFEAALYPVALDGAMLLAADDYTDYNSFPVLEFEMEDNKPIGFVVSPPQEGLIFKWPMNAITNARAEIKKDDELLATLTGVVWPEVYWE